MTHTGFSTDMMCMYSGSVSLLLTWCLWVFGFVHVISSFRER